MIRRLSIVLALGLALSAVGATAAYASSITKPPQVTVGNDAHVPRLPE